MEECQKFKIGMILGNQCDIIIKLSHVWIPHLNDQMRKNHSTKYPNGPFISAEETRGWSLLKYILNMMTSSVEEVLEMKKNNYEAQWNILNEFGALVVNVYKPREDQYSWYWHYLVVHLIYMLDYWASRPFPLSLASLSTQGYDLTLELLRSLVIS